MALTNNWHRVFNERPFLTIQDTIKTLRKRTNGHDRMDKARVTKKTGQGGRSTRLRFKQRPAGKSRVTDDVDMTPVGSPDDDKTLPINTQYSDLDKEYSEWGPSINGYRFVGTEDSPKYYQKRHNLVTETPMSSLSNEKTFYNWSYMELPKYTAAAPVEDNIEQKYGGGEGEAKSDEVVPYTYDEYYKEWESIRKEGKRNVIFPLPRATDELNSENVQKFIDTAREYGGALKVERARWHPDRMRNTLRIEHNSEDVGDLLLVNKITITFQIINQLWEKYTGK